MRKIMSKVEDINNHMAWTCNCGCCRFNLIRSGKIECDECGEIQDGKHNLNNSCEVKKSLIDQPIM